MRSRLANRGIAWSGVAHGALPLTAALLWLSACSGQFQKDDSAPAVQNQCTNDNVCGVGGVCRLGACYADMGTLDTVTIEVQPGELATFGGGLSFLVQESGLAAGDLTRKIELPQVSQLALGTVIADLASPLDGCMFDAATRSLAAHVDITRSDATPGIAAGTSGIDAELRSGPIDMAAGADGGDAGAGVPAGQWVFAPLRLAPSTYDLVVRPANPTTCDVAPLLLRGIALPPGDVQLPLALPPPKTIGGTVTPPIGTRLEGWTVDLIEPERGVVISTSARLGASSPTNFLVSYRPPQTATVQNNANGTPQLALSGQVGGVPYLRFSPPAGTAAPTMYWNLAGADFDGDGSVALDASGLAITPVLIGGRVTGGGGSPVAAAMTFLSSSLDGAPTGLIAAFSTTIQTADDGTFAVNLLPGNYRCVAIPSTNGSGTWSITQHDWAVAPTDTAVRSFVVNAKAVLTGTVLVDGLGSGLANASITAAPVVSAAGASVLGAASAKSPLPPRAATASTASDGRFTLPLDNGDYSVSIEPPERVGFPWYVAPVVSAAGASSTWPGAAPIELPLPVAVAGNVVSPEGSPVGGAIVRAYASSLGGVPVKVGETRTLDDGHYQLLLPARFGP